MLFQPIQANAYQSKVDDTFTCLNATQKIEKEFQIKEHLLTTISSVETGRWNEVHKQNLAWPWTINAEGKGQYFATKAEAVKAVKKLQAQGVKSIDVGCMQINLSYHGDAFENVEEAFDPETNVTYAAKFLSSLYEKRGKSWINAAMAYHSSVESKAVRYKNKIMANYDRIKQANDALSAKLLLAEETSARIKQAQAPEVASIVITPSVKPSNVPNKREQARISANEWREAKLEEYRRSRAQ